MTPPEKCPKCLSVYPDIRGIIYPSDGETYRCDNKWHYGSAWNNLDLTEDDKKLLHGMLIQV